MKISRKGLWAIIICLFVILLGETCLTRTSLRTTYAYYRTKLTKQLKKIENQKDADEKLSNFLSADISEKSVLYFEPNPYHHECTPGYVKYFTDLGYNVDLLIRANNEDCMELFEPKDKIRIFTFDNLDQIDFKNKDICEKAKKYERVFLQTLDPTIKGMKELVQNLGFYDHSGSMIVLHDTNLIRELGVKNFVKQNRIITLGDFGKALYVNPNYFGNIPEHTKNKKTRFFITSNSGKNYLPFIRSIQELDKQGLDFEIVVVGRTKEFSTYNLPVNLRKYFTFKQSIPYKDMYKELMQSDYILIYFDPNGTLDAQFKKRRITGSAQLAYGFAKPAIIHEDFYKTYKFTDKENAFLYYDGFLGKAMKDAIMLNSTDYTKMVHSMNSLRESIYNKSMENIKLCLETNPRN